MCTEGSLCVIKVRNTSKSTEPRKNKHTDTENKQSALCYTDRQAELIMRESDALTFFVYMLCVPHMFTWGIVARHKGMFVFYN